MKRFLLLLMTLVLAALQSMATITITTDETVTIGSTTYSGYGIYGANEGEIALLLSGDNSVTVQWNGGSLNQLKSAEYVKIGSTSNPNVLNDADLDALQNLSGAKFLDIDGSTLADGANIANIKAGSAIEAVTLPNGLPKEKVNAAGASLTACNSSFGACLSLVAEMEEQEKTQYWYDDPCSGNTRLEYIGTVNGNSGHVDNITRPLTFTGSSITYVNSKYNDDVMTADPSQVQNGMVVPNPLKVKLTHLDNPQTIYQIEYNGQILTVPTHAVDTNTNTVSQEFNCAETNWQNTVGLTGQPVTVLTSEYSYTFMKGGWEQPFNFFGEPDGNATDGYYAMVENIYIANNQGYQFEVTSTYNYTYTNERCEVATISYTDGPHETKDVPYNQDVTLTTTTKIINVPVEDGDCEVIAYVNTAGSLYKATSLDINDVAKATGVVISGNINNGDISWYGENSNDPFSNNGGGSSDADAYPANNAPVALVNWGTAPESIDIGDAVIDDYKHLRVLRNFGKDLKRVVLPKTATRIPNRCFESAESNGCYNLDDVVFPTDVPFTIGDNAFKNTAIKSLLLPSGVTQVGDNAFAYCPKLTDVEMEGLDAACHFGNNVFEQCVALKHVTLSEKVENIGDNMFLRCGLLESIRIPSTCETIGSESFKFCFSIHQITIPEGVKLIKENAFEEAGLTDIYLMATTPANLPKIYAMSPTGAGPSTFSYQRTTGNNTVPDDQGHLSRIRSADYDEVLTWYQEDQSGPQGLGTGNCLTALHYPESMKDFFEGIDYQDFPDLDLTGVVNYKTYEEYLALIPEGTDKVNTRCLLENKLKVNGAVSETQARDFGTEEYKYLPQSYSIDPDGATNSDILLVGPDKDGRYYPIQECYIARMAAGATGEVAGGVNQGESGLPVASQWGWRQFPLSSSIESIGEIPFEKEYDDTWYTMAFPWRMIDNQLFSAFNQKMEIVEFVGAEVLDADDPSTDTKEYNLVFHFEDVADTYYMNDDDEEFARERDGDKVDAAGHRIWIYTSKKDGTVVKCPDEVLSSGYNPKNASPEVKEAYGKYLNIQNVMVLPGHPYMIHPSIGAAPGVPAKVYINGVKKIAVGEGKKYASYEDLAEANKVKKTVSSRTRIKTIDQNGIVEYTYDGPEAWTNPENSAPGGQYYFIGNINDAVETNGVSDNGAQDTPLPCYILALPPGEQYPKYYRKSSGGKGKWSQYSAIIVPDETAKANVESLYLNKVTSPTGTGLAKGAFVELGEWDFNETVIIEENKISTIIDEALEKDPSTPIIRMNVVYNIKGQVVSNDSGSLEGLPKGIYIVNGKKYLVK